MRVPLVGLEQVPKNTGKTAVPDQSGAKSDATGGDSGSLVNLDALAAALRVLSPEERAKLAALLSDGT
jgi:hypothetical protein